MNLPLTDFTLTSFAFPEKSVKDSKFPGIHHAAHKTAALIKIKIQNPGLTGFRGGRKNQNSRKMIATAKNNKADLTNPIFFIFDFAYLSVNIFPVLSLIKIEFSYNQIYAVLFHLLPSYIKNNCRKYNRRDKKCRETITNSDYQTFSTKISAVMNISTASLNPCRKKSKNLIYIPLRICRNTSQATAAAGMNTFKHWRLLCATKNTTI